MPDDPSALRINRRWDELKNARLVYESQWNDIQKLVRIHAKSLYSQTEGDRRFDGIFDGTAVLACEDLASGLHSYLTDPADRWFGLEVQGAHMINEDPQVMLWLDLVSDIIYQVYRDNGSAFTTALHEAYLDLGGFGHTIIFQGKDRDSCAKFRTFPVGDCWTDEDKDGRVDTVFRQIKYSGRQILQEWPDSAPEQVKKPEAQDKQFVVLHAVYPRTDRNVLKSNSLNMPWASVYTIPEFRTVLSEGGFQEFPYHVPRWYKISDEKYGRSPAQVCLPDIRMLNKMEVVTIRAGTKAVDPPLVIPDDGFMLPIKTHPGALIFRDMAAGNGAEIQPLVHQGNLPWAEEKSEQKRDAIRRAFHTDWVKRVRKNKNIEQSATEIIDDRDESLKMMAPTVGRLQAEMLEPCLRRTYRLLNERGYLPPAPRILSGRNLRIIYLSPAARAQAGTKATNIGRTLTDVAPIAQLDPTVLDAFNMDNVVAELAKARQLPRSVIRTTEEIAQIRANRQRQQQVASVAGMVEPASKAALNLAKAKQAGGGIGA